MLNRFARSILTASSAAPVCFTLAFLALLYGNWILFTCSVVLFAASLLLCRMMLRQALQLNPVTLKNLVSATPADKEVTNFFLAYVFPLIVGPTTFMDLRLAAFFYVSLFFYIQHSSSYCFNPLLSALYGYKFYETTDDTGVGFVLLSRQPLLDARIKGLKVKKLTEHTYIDFERS